MVRFKVIKGSHLLLGAAVVVLALVIGGMALHFALTDRDAPVSTGASLAADVVEENGEAEIDSVFASLHLDENALSLDPEQDGSLTIELVPEETPPAVRPRILIYHTHTHEAYEQVDGDRYEAIEAWRTQDQDHSVVRVGQELAKLLRERGFDVTHDVTDHEQSDLSTAYTRSLETLESYTETFDLYIDLHRDAYIEGVEYPEIIADNRSVAQLMLLIGNGEGFSVKPHYKENKVFAECLTSRINEELPGLCKDVLVKDGRYNQNIGVFSILLEVGHNRNTLEEALNALPYFADAVRSLLIIDVPSDIESIKLSK